MPREKILLLEDHAETREQTAQVLLDAGYPVQTAGTAAEALDLARRDSFDLLIADIFLPDESGIKVFQEIRAIRPDIAGIVVTVHSTWDMVMDALQKGFVSFLVKPVVPEQLLAAIVSALEQEKLRRENARLRAFVPLYELSRAFMGTLELNDLLDQVVTTVQEETKAEVVSLMLLDDSPRELRIAAAAGLPNDIIETQKRVMGKGIAGWVAQRGEPVMIAEGIPLDPEIRDAMGKPEVLSALSLPLRSRGNVLGVLNLSRLRGSEPFTHADLELATVLAGQAANAIDKARLFNQVKLLSQISQRLARAADLDEASAIILKAPKELIGAEGASLWLMDSVVAPTLKTFELENRAAPALPRGRDAEEFHADGDAGWLTLSLHRAEKTLGSLSMRLPSRNPPGEEQLELLRTLAHAAAAVIELHGLRARELSAFREVDRAVRADLGLKDLLERLLNEMIAACEAEGGGIFLWDAARARLEPWVAQGLAVRPEFASETLRTERARSLPDPTGALSVIGAPMMTGNRIGGAAVLLRPSQSGAFHAGQIDFLSTLASAAALAVRNAQLYARSEEAAIAEERTRIAREIHDGLAQDLSYLVLKIGVTQKLLTRGKYENLQKELRGISDQLRRDIRDVRRIIFALRPLDIEAQGFLPALTKFVKDFGQANEIQLELSVQGELSHLPPKLEIALFRLAQEALNNIRKHARAKHAWIELSVDDHHAAILRVRDDGRGFDVEQGFKAARERGSVGLVQMRERAERAGGTFTIESAPGQGARVQVQLPIREL
ncbi:MAG: GAF domain-containing protein [Chloroflexota bacterium]|nr:GAF domain-containing protein [Chloroflexota bacterium]